MKSIFKPLLITAVLASSAMLAQAQTSPAGQGMMHARAHGDHGRMDPAKMQERMAARMAELKAKLNLNAAQEGGWNEFLAAMQQRLDRMAAMRAERDAQMRQREQATRNFYDLLSTEQQKVFDANAMMGGGHHGKRGGKGGHRHG